MMLRHLTSLSMICALALATGCGTPAEDNAGNTTPDVQADTGNVVTDTASGDILFQPDTAAQDTTGADTTGTDTSAPDVAAGDAGGDTTGSSQCEGSGGFNCPCKDNDECDTGYCLQGPDGKICTKTCLESCPGGFKCVQTGESGDLVYLCAPTDTTLCQPCEQESDCDHVGITKGAARCLPMQDGAGGTVGSFCTAPCGDGVGCPTGYSCKELDLAEGKTQQCVPDVGTTCKCNDWGKLEKAATTCSVHNDKGTCWGSRVCTSAGLGACTAVPAVVELCNMKDDDCDGDTDEGHGFNDGGVMKALGAACGSGACTGGLVVCKADGSGATCDNSGKSKKETCNFIDDNCNGETDENLTVTDSDCKLTGVCTADKVAASCKIGQWNCEYSAVPNYEDVSETTCDGKDNDCDGLTDESFVYGSAKLAVGAPCDGIGACGAGVVVCAANAKGVACSTDPDGGQSQATTEVCDDLDNDCDGQVDEGCDDDGDGHCDKDMTVVGTPSVCKVAGPDCNDANKAVYPKAPELCNDVDDDCDGVTDNGCDKDGDGVCDAQAVVVGQPKVCAKGKGDCDDSDKTVSPVADELCNGVDDDCDGKTDAADEADLTKNAPTCENQKGVCKGAKKPAALCVKGAWGLCNDSVYLKHDATFSNAKDESLCDDLDNNCSGATDESCDGDGDGYCDEKLTTKGKPKACPKGGGDCDDDVKSVNPGAQEICDAKATDENCSGKAEEQDALKCKAFYFDGDGDGAGKEDTTAKCLCAADVVGKYTAPKADDCDDKKKNVHPNAKESCATPYDDNCDDDPNNVGAKGCLNFYTDADGDGFGDKTKPAVCMCAPKIPQKLTATKGGDCEDLNGSVNPSKQESCLTSGDDNCNNDNNDVNAIGCSPFYKDGDKDGYGAKGSKPLCLCKANTTLKYTAVKAGDCDDASGAVKPGVQDNCVTNGIDDNCDGKTDEENSLSCQQYFYDGDKDGYGTGGPRCLCNGDAATKHTAKLSGDCNDGNASIKPKAKELCNGVDDDCDKVKDDGASASCAAVKNASVTCKSPSCAINQCKYGYFDLDKKYSTGCECGADGNYGGAGGSCSKPIILSTMKDIDKKLTYVSGNLMPGETGQWYRVYMQDSTDYNACDNYDVRIRFTQNPGDVFRMDVYRGSCSGSSLICKDETEHRYKVDFYGSTSGPKSFVGKRKGSKYYTPYPVKGGECKCTTKNGSTGPGIPGYNQCKSQSAYYYINVHYKTGVGPVCSNFQVQISNGYY